MTLLRRAAGSLLVACLLLAGAGCTSHGPLLDATGRSVELVQTPFFPQPKFQCGPATLAMVLGASGIAVTPAAMEPLVYLPGRRGSLQLEMLAAPRGLNRLSYTLDPDLAAITAELDAGRPVLVLHNYGLPSWPRWHYAVVIGYDSEREELVLRSGTTQREIWPARRFMRAWDNGGRWAMVLLRPGELPAHAEPVRYLEAAAAFEKSATADAARAAFDAAVNAWPQQAVARVGRGTAHYRLGAFDEAARDYTAALEIDGSLAGARNNLAMALLEKGCARKAQQQLDQLDASTLSATLRAEIHDTQRQIRQHDGADPPSCNTTAP